MLKHLMHPEDNFLKISLLSIGKPFYSDKKKKTKEHVNHSMKLRIC